MRQRALALAVVLVLLVIAGVWAIGQLLGPGLEACGGHLTTGPDGSAICADLPQATP